VPNHVSAAFYHRGRWDQRSKDVARLIDGGRRPDVASRLHHLQGQWTSYVLAGHDQTERDRRTKNSPTLEELAVRASELADEELVAALERANEKLASTQAGARSYGDYRSRQAERARQSRNYFTDDPGQRWTLFQVVQELVRKPDLLQATTRDLWIALTQRLDEMGLAPVELKDERNSADEELQQFISENPLTRPFILYGVKPPISSRSRRSSKRVDESRSDGSSSAAEVESVRPYHVTYKHFCNLVTRARRQRRVAP
jgi:hypothetical protein